MLEACSMPDDRLQRHRMSHCGPSVPTYPVLDGEADLVDVEGLGPIDIRHGNGDEFEAKVRV